MHTLVNSSPVAVTEAGTLSLGAVMMTLPPATIHTTSNQRACSQETARRAGTAPCVGVQAAPRWKGLAFEEHGQPSGARRQQFALS